ncbi:MAG: ABC transporter substrate-binding protein [Spirochaetales bacterium]|nr:ABC transporter substrate-binding protein [Spirochaetales bacterium]
MKKGFIVLAVILFILVSLLNGCAKSKSSQEDAGIIKVGVAQALSGPIAPYGESIRKGILLAIKQINEQEYAGKGIKIQLIIEDTGGDREQTTNVFKKFITRDKVAAILGPTLDDCAFTADPLAQNAGIPVIGSSTVAEGITDIGDCVFRTCHPESVIISNTILTLVEKRGMSGVAVMYGNNDQYTKNGFDFFSAALAANKVTVLTVEPFARGDTDFHTQLKKIKPLNPQAIITSALAEEAATIMIQAHELGMTDVYFVGGNGFNTRRLIQIAGKNAEGAVSGAAWFLHNPVPENKQFIKNFGSVYLMDPDQFAAHAYAAALVLAEAIRRTGFSLSSRYIKPGAIRDELSRIINFPTPLGNFSFDKNREPLYKPAVLIIQNTVFSLFEK